MILEESKYDFLTPEGDLIIRFNKMTEQIPLHTILYMESSLRKMIIL